MGNLSQQLRFVRPALHLAAALAVIGSGLGTIAPALASRPSVSVAAPAAASAAVKSNAPRAPHGTAAPKVITPASSCSTAGSIETCDLWAISGLYSLAVTTGTLSLPVYAYATSAAGPAALPGPTLVVTAGNTLVVNLHNNLTEATSLSLSEEPNAIPDTIGAAPGGSKAYTYSNVQAGTYLYEAGLTANGPRQEALGLYGALVVRPAANANTLYDAKSAFNDEDVLVLSEIDPALNYNPGAFYMPEYHPTYWLINGKVYSNTDVISAAPGDTVALRYVNAGLKHHSMTLYGPRQTMVAVDGNPYSYTHDIVAQTIPTGETLDTIVSVTVSTPLGTYYPIFDAAMRLDNNGASASPANANPAYTQLAYGGMLAFIYVTGANTANGGPTTTNVTIAPNPTNGAVPVTLSATFTSVTSTVTAAEYFTDTLGAPGTGVPVPATYGTAVVNGQVVLSPAALATLTGGYHTFYVRAQAADGVWGAPGSVTLDLDTLGPVVQSLGLTPARTNGQVDVALQGTASDLLTGGSVVIAAEYFIDPVGTPAPGTGTALAESVIATVASLNATIPAATVLALSEGVHTVAVRAEDAYGNWGAFSNITLTVDKTAPTASGVSTQPNPTNGKTGVQLGSNGVLYQRIDATVSDPTSGGLNSNIVAAEYFFDTAGANGTGGAMLASNGVFDGPSKAVYTGVDIFVIQGLAQGQHTIYVHGLDAAGNWGAFATGTFVVDKTGPAISAFTLTPNPYNGTLPWSTTLHATATDPANTPGPGAPPSVTTGAASNVVTAEYYINGDLGAGNNVSIPIAVPAPSVSLNAVIPLAGMQVGSYTIGVRALDAAGNWGPVSTQTLTISSLPNLIFADGFESGNFTAWSARGGNLARTVVNAAARQAPSSFGMQATVSGGTSGYVQDNTPINEYTYHGRFYVNPHNVALGNTTPDIFVGLNAAGATVFRVQLRLNGGNYQVRALVSRLGGTNTTNWFTIGANSFTRVEVAWANGAASSFSLYVGASAVPAQTLGGLNTSGFTVETVRLGMMTALGGVTGSVYFDSFVSQRNTVVGP